MFKTALFAAAVSAAPMEDFEVEVFDEDIELRNYFVARPWSRAYKFGAGWCGHAGSYVDYADLNGDGRADQICSDHLGRHWHRMAYGNASFAGTVYHANIAGWCRGNAFWTRFADLNGDNRVEMVCDDFHGNHWAMLGLGGNWNPAKTIKHSNGWCSHAGSYTQYADVNGDNKDDMTCDDTFGRHWTAYSRGNGTFYYKYHAPLYRWCGHAGAVTLWADVNGDGKKDITCQDREGRHWSRLSTGFFFLGSTQYHGANWCRGGFTRYSNFWMDVYHKKAEDMMCDIGAWHFIRPSLGNGWFHKNTWRILSSGWCNALGTHYANVNGNDVDDMICSVNGHHWVLAH